MSLFSKKQSQDVPRRRQSAGSESRRDVAAERQQEANITFKRNRTLTGSVSSRVVSASEPLADLRSPRTHAHHLARQRRKLGGVFIAVMLALFVVAGLLYELTATPVVASTDPVVSLQKGRYEKAIEDYLGRWPVERLRFALNEQRLQEYLQRSLPEVEMIKEDGFSGFGASRFIVGTRQPIAGWLIGDKQYYVDASGVPFQINYYTDPVVKIVDNSGIKQTTGTAIASSRFLTFVGLAVSLANDKGMKIEEAIIPLATTRQVELKAEGYSYPVKLSLDRPVGEQIEDMQRAMAWFDQKSVTPKYVDVRVSGKAFYR